MPNTRAVLFDLYGTLIYEEPDSVSLQRQMASLSCVDAEAFLAARSRTMEAAMRDEHASALARALAVLRLLGEDDPSRAELLAREEERLRRAAIRLYPSALEVLSALRAMGLGIGAVSNGTSLWRTFLEQLGLEPYFDAVAISCERGICKPEVELFLWVTERLEVDPEECIYVGDGDGGEMEAARDLGMRAVLIDQPGSWVRLTGAPVHRDRRITHLGELLGIVSGPT